MGVKLTGTLRSTSSGGAFALAAVAGLAIIVILGIAGVVLGTQCVIPGMSLGRCLAQTDPIVTASAEPGAVAEDNITTLPMTTPPAVPAKTMDQAAAPPPSDDLVDATFESLIAEANQALADWSAKAASDTAAASPEAGDDSPTVPEWEVEPLAFAAPKPTGPQVAAPIPASREPVAKVAYAPEPEAREAAPADDSAAAAVTSLASPDSEAPAEQPAAPAEESASSTPEGSDKRIVGGAGVNVRSGPGKANSKLFALAAGQEVTVTGNQRGWLSVVDAEGRSGWIYKDYLSSPN
jgi:hypothetical protein